MRRRAFIAGLGSAAAWPVVARGQQPPDRMWRIGWLIASPSADRASIALQDAFKSKLQDLGYVEGRNITFDVRYGEGNYDRLPALASELVALAPDVIVSGATVAIAALQRSTSSIPIVMENSTDPIGSGFIKSLAKPGGNITGLSNQGPDYTAKSLEILHTITPNAKRIAVLRSPSTVHETLINESYEAAVSLGVTIIPVLARTPDDLDEAFLTMQKENCDALFVLIDPRITPKIVELAAKRRLPVMYQTTEFVKLGGLLSYSPDYREMFQRAAIYVDKILRGASPADLPVEQPTRFELAINLKTANRPKNSALVARPRGRGDRMTRRELIAVLGSAAVWAPLARAQQIVKTIGFMSGGSSSAFRPLVAVLVGRLRELGWVEGTNLVIDYRWADGRFARLPDYAAEFVGKKVDVIIAEGTVSVIAAMQSTRTIPIVFPVASDPIGNKLIDSLARPGGNVTGLSIQATDLASKRLELLREIVPGLTRLGVMGNFESPNAVVELREAEDIARSLGLGAKPIAIRPAEDIASVFEGLKERVDALYIAPDPLVLSNRETISVMALELRLPTIYAYRDYVESGGLVSYGPNIRGMFRRSAEFVDKVLRGTKAGDIPVEQPTHFELVINLKTAKALGLTIPTTLLARADEVIE